MGTNDAAEQLEVARTEYAKLEHLLANTMAALANTMDDLDAAREHEIARFGMHAPATIVPGQQIFTQEQVAELPLGTILRSERGALVRLDWDTDRLEPTVKCLSAPYRISVYELAAWAPLTVLHVDATPQI